MQDRMQVFYKNFFKNPPQNTQPGNSVFFLQYSLEKGVSPVKEDTPRRLFSSNCPDYSGK